MSTETTASTAQPNRVVIGFTTTDKKTTIKLNDEALPLFEGLKENSKFEEDFKGWLLMKHNNNSILNLPKLSKKVSKCFIYLTPTDIIIPTKNLSKSDALQAYPNISDAVGCVISGWDFIANPIRAVRRLEKNEKTEFYADCWGDTYNSNFRAEPRIDQLNPKTVFRAVEDILGFGKLAFQKHSYISACEKYQKAFHYCHKYYPEDLHEKDLETLTKLKIRALLNIAISAVQTNSVQWYKYAIESCEFVQEMPEATDIDLAKSYYREGRAYLLLKDDEIALQKFRKCMNLESSTRSDCEYMIQKCLEAAKIRKQKLKEKMAGAF